MIAITGKREGPMPVNDTIYLAVKNALVKDGWTISDDPLTIEYGDLYLFIDLGARRTVAAIRGDKLIAVEIKSFPSKSKVADLQQACGPIRGLLFGNEAS